VKFYTHKTLRKANPKNSVDCRSDRPAVIALPKKLAENEGFYILLFSIDVKAGILRSITALGESDVVGSIEDPNSIYKWMKGVSLGSLKLYYQDPKMIQMYGLLGTCLVIYIEKQSLFLALTSTIIPTITIITTVATIITITTHNNHNNYSCLFLTVCNMCRRPLPPL
jgi:hypothetical protein